MKSNSLRDRTVRQRDPKTDEQVCAQALMGFLESKGRIVTFREGEPDPPDFWFTVDGEKWAVEHTRILTPSGPSVGDTESKAVSIGEVIISRVEKALEDRPSLDSGWSVAIFGLVPSEDHSKAIGAILNAITPSQKTEKECYREVYRTPPWSPYKTIIQVRRCEDSSCGIHPIYSASAYGGDFDELARRVIPESIERKKATDLISEAKSREARVVLLLDGDGFFATADVVTCELERIFSTEPALLCGIDRIFLVRWHPFPN